MIHIKKFVDKVSMQEGKKHKDVVIPIEEARGLRDEISKLLADLNDHKDKRIKEEVIKIEVKGGSFK